MGLGVFPYVCMEGVQVQSFHCPVHSAMGASWNVGIAFKVPGKEVTIIGDDVSVNGQPLASGSLSGVEVTKTPSLKKNGKPTGNTDITVSVDELSIFTTKVIDEEVPTGYMMNFNLTMTEQDFTGNASKYSTGNQQSSCVCELAMSEKRGKDAINLIPVLTDPSDFLFSQATYDSMVSACGTPVGDPGTCGPQPKISTVCELAGIVPKDAKRACVEDCPCGDKNAIQECMFDFCEAAHNGVGDSGAGPACNVGNPCQ
jgi:hypothetical protein